MAQSLVFIFVMLLQSKTERKKKDKDAQAINCCAAYIFSPFLQTSDGRAVLWRSSFIKLSKPIDGERENWCSFLMHSGCIKVSKMKICPFRVNILQDQELSLCPTPAVST